MQKRKGLAFSFQANFTPAWCTQLSMRFTDGFYHVVLEGGGGSYANTGSE